MKKRQVFGFVVAGLLAGFVSYAVAQSATAYSSSAIGVIKKTLPAGKTALISVPLDQETDEGEGFVFGTVPSISNMPNGSVANFWDASNQKWVSQSKTTKNGWGEQKTRLIKPGESFFLKNAQNSDYELIVSGEVPIDASISQGLMGGAAVLVANPYPVPMVFTNFSFAASVPNGSVANFWDVDTQRWVSQSKTTKNGWGEQKNRVIEPGEGFFLKASGSDVAWTETRPYTWPN